MEFCHEIPFAMLNHLVYLKFVTDYKGSKMQTSHILLIDGIYFLAPFSTCLEECFLLHLTDYIVIV